MDTTGKAQRKFSRLFVIFLGVLAIAGAVTFLIRPSNDTTSPVALNTNYAAAAAGQVVLRPGDKINDIVRSKPHGTTFIFEPGFYPLSQKIYVRTGDSFIGRGDVVLSGARRLTGWQRDADGRWYVGGQTQGGAVTFHPDWQPCENTHPRCIYPEDLFVDGAPLHHVDALSKLGAGKWFFDYAADRIYVHDDPNGKTVLTSVTDMAFVGLANNVTIRNLTVEMFASPTQVGAIQANGSGTNLSSGWLVENVTARWNHGIGVNLVGHRHTVRNSRLLHNGIKGLGAGGTTAMQATGILIEDNEIAWNNWARGKQNFDCSGSKFVRTDGIVIRGNVAHHNYGKGLWTDIDNRDALIERNIVYANTSNGIYHEISWKATIRDNWAGYNGEQDTDNTGVYHAQIMVVNSTDVEVANNTLVVGGKGNAVGLEQNSRSEENELKFGKPRTNNAWVHDNIVIFTKVGARGNTGMSATLEADSAFRLGNNRFDRNTYYVSSQNDLVTPRFVWRSGTNNRAHLDWNAYRAAGHEPNSQVIVGVPAELIAQPMPAGSVAGAAPRCQNATLRGVPGLAILTTLNPGATYAVNAQSGETLLNIVANCTPNTESVKFLVDEAFERMENAAPYEIAGDNQPRAFAAGRSYQITMIPYTRDNASGLAGAPLTFTLTTAQVVAVAPTQPTPTATFTLTPPTLIPTEIVVTLTPTSTPLPPTVEITATPEPTPEPTAEAVIEQLIVDPTVVPSQPKRTKYVIQITFWVEEE